MVSTADVVPQPFDINRPKGEGKATAMLPTLGLNSGAFPSGYQPRDVDEYLHAMHSTIGDVAKATSDHLMESAKALGMAVPEAFSYSTMAFMPDPGNYGLMQWPGLNPESLRKMSRENIIQQSIVRSRVADLARYSGLSTHPWKPGWSITLRDASASMNDQRRKDVRDAERFIQNCSREETFKDARERDASRIAPFEMFMRSFGDDSHTFDGWAIWTDMTARGQVSAFANLPAGMIRLAAPVQGYKGDSRYFAAMVDETGTPVMPLTRDQMTWKVRNVRNDPSVGLYGWPESEMAIQMIVAFQSAIKLNADTFTSNSIPNGMLLLTGDFFQQEQIDALMREWTNMKRGLSKMWGMPVMAVPEKGSVELIDFMDLKGQEIRYKDHLNLMGGLTCWMYQFPVRRAGLFASGGHRDNQPVSDGSIELQGVDDPGLPALLLHVENAINEYLLWPNWPELSFSFLNRDPKSDARGYEARKLARTWGESRAEADLPKLTAVMPENLKELAEIMEFCPEDPNKAGVFQTVVSSLYGKDTSGGGDETPGSRMESKTDPAKSMGHGHASGTRRDSRAEKDRAAANSENATPSA